MRILIADDDHNLRYSFQRTLEGRGYEFIEAADGLEAVDKVRRESPDVVVIDVRMPGMDGLEAFEHIKAIAPSLPVIIMTAYGTTEMAIEAMRRGAVDYTLKPFDVEEMEEMLRRAVRQAGASASSSCVKLEPIGQPRGEGDAPVARRLVGSSRAMQQVYKAIGQVADSDVNVLILGESGTGKELVARAVHEHSQRSREPFIAINCAAIPESLIESELFGHERGAFTGAHQSRKGILQVCDGGTIFLDEIGEIPPAVQSKLLRFLQEGEIIPIGDPTPIQLDVRVIAATNQDLSAAVASGEFRKDLFFRLNAVSIPLPPLSDRVEDLGELVAHFVNAFNGEYAKSFSQISGAAMAHLRRRAWPGNVRELENVIRKAVIVGKGEVLLTQHLVGEADSTERARNGTDDSPPLKTVRDSIDQLLACFDGEDHQRLLPTVERLLIERALERVDGNQVKAASLLGISRTTLRSRLERYRSQADSDESTDEI